MFIKNKRSGLNYSMLSYPMYKRFMFQSMNGKRWDFIEGIDLLEKTIISDAYKESVIRTERFLKSLETPKIFSTLIFLPFRINSP